MDKRNKSVDIIRGFAMLMVVLGHTISGSSINYEHNFIFQVIWTLQMPLFILISGYVTRYSKSINNINELSKYIKKRSLAYMLPWLIWTFLIRGLIFDESKYLNLKYILWNMDSGYWFLATIWTISLLFGLAEYFANKISLSKIPRTIIRVSGCLIWMVLLGLLGFKLGLNFFAIKLTLYYFPFYIIGYIYGQFQDTISTSVVNKYKNIFTGVCLLVWVYLINRIDFYSGNDDIGFIITRFVTSLIGCISVTSLIINWANSLRGGDIRNGRHLLIGDLYVPLSELKCNSSPSITSFLNTFRIDSNPSKLYNNSISSECNHLDLSKQSFSKPAIVLQEDNKLRLFLNWIGLNSIAIYLLHGFFLCPLKYYTPVSISDFKSIIFICFNFIITIVCCILLISLINQNKFLNKLLFWK